MNKEGKKIAFSFSKVQKNALVNKVNIQPKEKIEYVDCFDGSKGKFSFKGNIRNDEAEKPELVIPMPISRTSTDIVKSRIEEKVKRNLESVGSEKKENQLEKPIERKPEGNKESQIKVKNIEELAALELLNEVQNGSTDNTAHSKLIIEAKEVPQEASDTDIDYDNVPVTDFGLAMLRGMGWRPDLGIGKEPRLVEATSPKLRPKGLGLGAKPNAETNEGKKEGEKEKLKVHSSDRRSKRH